MRAAYLTLLVVMLAPAVAHAAEAVAPGSSSGVWALVGAFIGQAASSAVFTRRAVAAHEARCRGYAASSTARPEES